MNLDLYEPILLHRGFSVFSYGKETSGKVHFSELPKSAIIKAFLEDDEIQEIQLVSSNIGFSRTFTKQFKRIHLPDTGIRDESKQSPPEK